MTGLLLSKGFVAQFGEQLDQAMQAAGLQPQIIHLPDDPEQQLDPTLVAQIEIAYLTRDLRFTPYYPSFCAAVSAAQQLRWMHFTSAALDQYPFMDALLAHRVRLTSSAGTNGVPVGHTAIGGLLMMARGFPRWLQAQREQRWDPARGAAAPRDLKGQRIIIVGVGTIGATVAQFCQQLGMTVIGVRRSPRLPADPVDEMITLDQLPAYLPGCDWLVLACPDTPETHHLVNAQVLASLPKQACLINVARGGVVDEQALIAALKQQQIAGAYLDVFATEPLPPDSPLWDMPNVVISPHNAAAAAGNDGRAARIFTENMMRYASGQTMINEQL